MLNSKDQEIEELKSQVSALETQIRNLGYRPCTMREKMDQETHPALETRPLKLEEYERYGRQMILPGFGLPSQLALRSSSVLVVGAGGLGCPALMYLVSAGVGKLTIVDHDTVELSNLHRQILHGTDMIGKAKVESARQALLRINPSVQITALRVPLSSHTLSDVFVPENAYDAVLDCSDTPSTRYLLSDTTARLGIPLISGAAQRTDGQLIVYNLPPPISHTSACSNVDAEAATSATGPCMRCVFPSVSRTGAGAERCSDVGVLGPVVGVIGVLMALETIKILTGFGKDECESQRPSMLLYTALSPRPFKTIKLRPRQSGCRGCSTALLDSASQKQSLSDALAGIETLEDDYVEFCSVSAGATGRDDPISTGMHIGKPGKRVDALVLRDALATSDSATSLTVTIIDTRLPTEFGICSIPKSINVPLAQLLKTPEKYLPSQPSRTFVVCRLGNDSQIAADTLREAFQARRGAVLTDEGQAAHEIVDVIGGLHAWRRDVDPSFPNY